MRSVRGREARFGVGLGLLTLAVAGIAAYWLPLDPRLTTSGAVDRSASDARIFRLQSQLSLARSSLGPWKEWYKNLELANPVDGVGPRFLRRNRVNKAVVHGRWVNRRHADSGQSIGPYATLIDVARQLRQLGIDFLILPVPPVSTIYPRQYVEGAPPGDNVPQYLDWRLRQLFLALEEEGIEVLDLVPAFLDPPSWTPPVVFEPTETPITSLDLLYRIQDRHWTATGSHLAAQVVADRLRRYPWFDEVARIMGHATIHDRWIVRASLGPIAQRLIQAGALPSDHPPEAYFERKTRIEEETWDLNDRQSPILLLGDSFSSHNYGFVDALLAELGYRIDLISIPGGDPSRLLDTLRLRQDGLAGKRLVIWEFAASSLSRGRRWRPIPLVGSGTHSAPSRE